MPKTTASAGRKVGNEHTRWGREDDEDRTYQSHMVARAGIKTGDADSRVSAGEFPDLWEADYFDCAMAHVGLGRHIAALPVMALERICSICQCLYSGSVLYQLCRLIYRQSPIWMVFQPQDVGLDGLSDVSFVLLSRQGAERVWTESVSDSDIFLSDLRCDSHHQQFLFSVDRLRENFLCGVWSCLLYRL